MPQLNAQLLTAYRATRYVVQAPAGEFTLRIGEPSPALSDLMIKADVSSAALLTAHNPQSQAVSDRQNQQAQAALCAALDKLPLACHSCRAIDPAGHWPAEPGVLALGISRAQALALVRQFKQNACVFIERSAIPQLLLADGAIIE